MGRGQAVKGVLLRGSGTESVRFLGRASFFLPLLRFRPDRRRSFLTGRSYGPAGLLPLPAQLPGRGPGLHILLMDHFAVPVPFRGLKDPHGIGVVLHQGDFFADERFNVFEQGLFAEVAECDSLAAPARPAGAPNAVDVGLGHLGEVVVEYVGQFLNIQAPGGDVGGHQAADPARLEVGQGLLPGGLAFVSVDGGGGDARFGQVTGHFVCPMLGAGKDQGVFDPLLFHQMGQQAGLVALVHQVDRLANNLYRG